jgi:hypothetical protein
VSWVGDTLVTYRTTLLNFRSRSQAYAKQADGESALCCTTCEICMHARYACRRRSQSGLWHPQPCKCSMTAVLTKDGTVGLSQKLSVPISGKGRRHWRRRSVACMMTKSPPNGTSRAMACIAFAVTGTPKALLIAYDFVFRGHAWLAAVHGCRTSRTLSFQLNAWHTLCKDGG